MRPVFERVFVAVIVLSCGTATGADRPNFVLCMADDQGWGDMAYNGHLALHTPVFDEMARCGLRLDRFYAAAPVCSPTRGSVLTGRTPNRYGVFSWGHSLRPREVTLAEALQSAGYATGHFGKWHLGSVLDQSRTSPGSNGFEEWLSAPNFFEVDPWLSARGRAVEKKGEGSHIVVQAAIEFIASQHEAGRPFCAVIWFGSPHLPHVGTTVDVARYSDQPKRQQHFLAEITAMDRAMGELRRAIRDMGLANDTLLWYCSDNGAIPQGSTGGLRGRKGQLYEGGLRVPCLIEWKRIAAPRRSRFVAGTVDIYPTLLELAGARPDHQPPLDGQSLVPLFDGHATRRRQPLGFWDVRVSGVRTSSTEILSFVADRQQSDGRVPADHPAHGAAPAAEFWDEPAGRFPGHAAWLDEQWKLHRVESRQKPGRKVRWELYDLSRDATEWRDLYKQEPGRVRRMQEQLEAWLASVTASLRGEDYEPAAAN